MSLLTGEGRRCLIVGDHGPQNKELAPLAAKTVAMRDKITSRHSKRLINGAKFVTERVHLESQ